MMKSLKDSKVDKLINKGAKINNPNSLEIGQEVDGSDTGAVAALWT